MINKHENTVSESTENLTFIVNVAGACRFELKGGAHCFSMQVIINKCFLLNLEKKIVTDPSCRFREKRTFNSANNVTEPKARLF